MSKKLPQRPNLDHLRRQAKALLSALQAGDKEAVATLREHLPAAKKMTPAQVRKTRFCLADAQSAIARKTGFANWPQLARHVDQLRALEGTWEFDSLEVDGRLMPATMLVTSRILIDGDCFRSEMGGTAYEGLFNIEVEKNPHAIDIEFVSGPEAGNWNYGIFTLDTDRLTICIDTSGKGRPAAFRTAPGSHCALETLRRTSCARPESVTGGAQASPAVEIASPADFVYVDSPTLARLQAESVTGGAAQTSPAVEIASPADFVYVDSPTLARLQGDWTAVKVVHDGNELPPSMCATGLRSANKIELKVTFGGQVMIHALVRIHENTNPTQVDYCLLAAPVKGTLQYGIMKWIGDEACFCMASPGTPRPTDFNCPAGSGQTLSQWRLRRK